MAVAAGIVGDEVMECFDGGSTGSRILFPKGCAVADPQAHTNDKSRATFKAF